jgi:hypothetical protein
MVVARRLAEVPLGAELPAEELARSLRAEGWRYAAIAHELNRRGYSTAYGRPWRDYTVRRMLSGVTAAPPPGDPLDDEPPATDEELLEAARLRPRTRGDCLHGLRPCPWMACRYHLAVTGGAQPTRDPLALDETCCLDVADRGPHTLDAIVRLAGFRTRQRCDQVVRAVMGKLRERLEALRLEGHEVRRNPEQNEYGEPVEVWRGPRRGR